MTEKMLTLESYMAEQIEALKEAIGFYQGMLNSTQIELDAARKKLREAETLYQHARTHQDDGK